MQPRLRKRLVWVTAPIPFFNRHSSASRKLFPPNLPLSRWRLSSWSRMERKDKMWLTRTMQQLTVVVNIKNLLLIPHGLNCLLTKIRMAMFPHSSKKLFVLSTHNRAICWKFLTLWRTIQSTERGKTAQQLSRSVVLQHLFPFGMPIIASSVTSVLTAVPTQPSVRLFWMITKRPALRARPWTFLHPNSSKACNSVFRLTCSIV